MGGDSAKEQIRTLQAGVDIVCGTPGRLDDLITTGKLDLSGVSTVPFPNHIWNGTRMIGNGEKDGKDEY